MGTENVTLKLTASIAVGGNILRRGQLVEVTEVEARGLLARGKAELATSADEPAPVAQDAAAVFIDGVPVVDKEEE